MVKFKDALQDFKKHSEREYHYSAIVESYEFVKCFEGKQQNIDTQFDNQ